MENSIKMIVPVGNGFVLLPFDLECIVPINRQEVAIGVEVATDADGLAELVRRAYTKPDPEGPAEPA